MNTKALPKNPDLELAQLKFLLSCEQHTNDAEKRQKLIDAIKSNDMSPFYEQVCKDLVWTVDSKLLAAMKERNEVQLKELDAAIKYAEQNLGEMEVRESNLNKAEYLCRIGSKEA